MYELLLRYLHDVYKKYRAALHSATRSVCLKKCVVSLIVRVVYDWFRRIASFVIRYLLLETFVEFL